MTGRSTGAAGTRRLWLAPIWRTTGWFPTASCARPPNARARPGSSWPARWRTRPPPAGSSAAAANAPHAKPAGKKGRRSPKRPQVDFEERLYAAEPHTILALLRETPPKVHSLLIVGHNPGIHEAALALIASGDVEARERLHEKFPTSALAVIDFALDEWSKLHARSGRLDRFITPRQLAVEPE